MHRGGKLYRARVSQGIHRSQWCTNNPQMCINRQCLPMNLIRQQVRHPCRKRVHSNARRPEREIRRDNVIFNFASFSILRAIDDGVFGDFLDASVDDDVHCFTFESFFSVFGDGLRVGVQDMVPFKETSAQPFGQSDELMNLD